MIRKIISVIMGLFMLPAVPAASIDSPLVSFSYSYAGMAMPPIEGISARRDEDGCFADFHLGHAEDIENVPISTEDFDKLECILREYEIGSWAGFDEVDPYMLDGESFTLCAAFEDGTRIEAHGSNSFPQRYWDVKDTLLSCIEQIMSNCGIYLRTE